MKEAPQQLQTPQELISKQLQEPPVLQRKSVNPPSRIVRTQLSLAAKKLDF